MLYARKINMNKMLDAMKKPNLWIILSVGYLWLLGIGKLIATLGPPFVISRIMETKNSFSISGFVNAFVIYAQEAAPKLGYTYKFVLYSFISNVLIFIPVIVVDYFVLQKRLWARNTLIVLILVYLFHPLGIGLLTSELNLSFIRLNSIVLVAIIYALMCKTTTDAFKGA